MAGSPEQTIINAANAYVAGNGQLLGDELEESVRIHGSHRSDRWSNRPDALSGLAAELQNHADPKRLQPQGGLINSALDPQLVLPSGQQVGDIAWWTTRGSLEIDGDYIEDASWTVVLRKAGEDWRIMHSHFSIHHTADSYAALFPQAAS